MGFEFDEQLNLILKETQMQSGFITEMFDTKDEDMTYNRLVLDGDFEDLRLEVTVATANDLDIFFNDEPARLDVLLASNEVSLTDKIALLDELPHVKMVDTKDILLYSLTGRYVWVFVSVLPYTAPSGVIRGFRLEFPKYTFTNYFPEIYQNNEFFERFVAIFQSLYLDVERKIDELPAMLDYERANETQLKELASWLGLGDLVKFFGKEKLCTIIKNIDTFQGGKGTYKALEKIITLATDIRPNIVESFRWNKNHSSHSKLYSELYGDTANDFCIILNMVNEKKSLPISIEELKHLIDDFTVIGTQYKLVCLNKSSHTDTYCYLDVNSYLSTPQSAEADNVKLGEFIVMG